MKEAIETHRRCGHRIESNSGHGAVRKFINDETIASDYQTNPDAEAAAIMILSRVLIYWHQAPQALH